MKAHGVFWLCVVYVVAGFLLAFAVSRCAPDVGELISSVTCDVTIPEQAVTREGPTVLKGVELKCSQTKK